MINEQNKKPYTAPTVKVIEVHCQSSLLACSNCRLEELGLSDRSKDFYA
jgi:hypothetical protein